MPTTTQPTSVILVVAGVLVVPTRHTVRRLTAALLRSLPLFCIVVVHSRPSHAGSCPEMGTPPTNSLLVDVDQLIC